MNFRTALLLASAAAGLPSIAMAQDDTAGVVRGPVPEWAPPLELLPVPEDATGLAYYRNQDSLIRLDDKGQSTFVTQRIKLLHPQALQIGNIELHWNPASGTPVVHALNVYRDGQVVDVLDSSSFEILRREESLDEAMLTGLLTAVLRVPDLRVGDELEFAYTLPSADPTLGSQSFGLLAMAHQPSPGRFRIGIRWADGQEPRIQLSKDLESSAVRGPDSLTVLFDEPEPIAPPRDAPQRYNWLRVIEYTDFASWKELSTRFATLFADAATLGSDSLVKAEAARIASAHATDAARAAAALKLVQQQVRYIYVGLNGGNFSPATADETWQRRYGDCKGKTVLLLALLKEMGIEAQPVLVSSTGDDDGFDARLPSPGLFDHVLVQAKVDGRSLWMDGTWPPVARASADPIIGYRWVLPLTAKGSTLEEVPRKPYALPQVMGLYEIDARDGFDEPATKTNTSISRGIAGLVQYQQFSALSADQLQTAFQTELAGSELWDTIESVKYRYDEKTQASILTIKGTGPIEWENDGSERRSLALPGGGFIPPSRLQRSRDQDRTAPYYAAPSYSCYATTVRVPESTSIDDWIFNSTFDTELFGRNYYRTMEIRQDGTIRMIRGSRQDLFEISPEQAAKDNGEIADFDNSKAVIRYWPGFMSRLEADEAGSDDSDDDGLSDVSVPASMLSKSKAATINTPRWQRETVPATYEIDWAAPDVPCLPEWILDE